MSRRTRSRRLAVVLGGTLAAACGGPGSGAPLLCAGALLILAPTLVIFLIFQRWFVTAPLQDSLKG
ncbi:hypothetical protein [Acrocarpospora sp. B8E8]|uniref:hypothetical protein n=1 Tax=Acrocarpospora sp. B8E8 TaxID=3153572 RepID=UPI00325E7833